jgi:mono/diheme cytochrome c family protein
VPRDYRTGLFKFIRSVPAANGKPSRDDLRRVLVRGVDGTAMPPFPNLTEADLDALVSYVIHLSARGEVEYQALRKLIKSPEDSDGPEAEVQSALKRVAERWGMATKTPMPMSLAPVYASAEERTAAALRGYTLFTAKDGAGCLSCHIDYGRANNLKYDSWGTIVQPRNLFLGLYRGGRTDEDLYARIYTGVNGSGMPAHKQLVDSAKPGEPDKIWDLVAFVRALAHPQQRAMLQSRGVKLD